MKYGNKNNHIAQLEQAVFAAQQNFNQQMAHTHLQFLQTCQRIACHEHSRMATTQPETPMVTATTQQYPTIRRLLAKILAPPEGKHMPGLTQLKHLAVTQDDAGVAPILVEKLIHSGCKAKLVTTVPKNVDGLIMLYGLDAPQTQKQAMQVNYKAFQTVQILAKNIKDTGVLVTVQNSGGDFGLSKITEMQAWQAGFPALAKTMQQEFPNASVKAIDIDTKDQTKEDIAERIFQEIIAGGPQLEVGLGEQRITIATRPENASTQDTLPIDNQSTIIVSGGARGVTAACLLELAKYAQPKLVLLGRTQLIDEKPEWQNVTDKAQLLQLIRTEAQQAGEKITPKELNQRATKILTCREIRTNIAALETAGCQVHYAGVDIQNKKALTKLLQTIRQQYGSITGIVHGAGVLADKRIADKTAEQFEFVFTTKIIGLENLLELTATDPLRFMVLFSSVAARFGNIGQCDYAMANEILNKVAQQQQLQRGNKCLVKSINWGPWEGGLVTPALSEQFKLRGIPLLPQDLGAQYFVNELRQKNYTDVEIVIGSPIENATVKTTAATYPITINAKQYPYLNSHTIDNNIVVPACLAQEILLQTAQSILPNQFVSGCRNLTVLKGIQLPDFTSQDSKFQIQTKPLYEQNDELLLDIKLVNAKQIPHYSGTIVITDKANISVTETLQPITNIQPWPEANIYQPQQLFHGPDFQAITNIEAGDNGMLVTIQADKMLSWSAQHDWISNVLMLDCAMQAIILWTRRQTSKIALPAAIGEYKQYPVNQFPTTVKLLLNIQQQDQFGFLSQAEFRNEAGQILATCQDIKSYMVQK